MVILFAGGGSLGPVTPLIATARALRRLVPDVTFAWAGTPDGPEREFAEAEDMEFYGVPVAKWPRYPSMRWFAFPRDVARASRVARKVVERVKPDVVVSVGGFTAVPVIRATSTAGIPCVIHQLDKIPSWSNRLVAKRCASVTTSFEYERPPFGARVRTERIPTPTRFLSSDAPTRDEAVRSFGLDPARPVVLVTGGGQGAKALNEAVYRRRDAWRKKTQIIHVCGRGKMGEFESREDYLVCELLDADSMRRAYAASDVVVTRAGMGALSEIASLSKPAVVVPIPKSHQVENIRAFAAAKSALYVAQNQPDFADILFQQTTDLLTDAERRSMLGDATHAFLPTDDGNALAERIVRVARPPITPPS
ncbi:MAG: glycosyltransferase [Candidatus Uhrbacteria bacterium]|nr:glycosyltransferase [Candidatus Uhrbacteria bacterium]